MRIAESVSCPHRGGFASITPISRELPEVAKTPPTWGGDAHCDTPRIRGQTHRICWKSRDPPPNLRVCFRATPRWVFADYSDFSGASRSRRKVPPLGAGMRITITPGSAAKRIGSSGNLEIPHRIAESAQDHVAVGFRRLRRFPRILRESAKTPHTRGADVRYDTPRVRGRSRRIFWESRDSPSNLTISHMTILDLRR